MSKNLIELKNITVSYDGKDEVITDFNLDIKKGEFTTLLGPSGCGKSTVLRLIAGFVAPNSGQVLLDGADITGAAPYDRPVNMVFQNYALFPHLNVFGNIAFGLNMKKLSKAEIDERVNWALKIVDMEGLQKRNIKTLSGGQQQRIAIARAIVNKPEALLLDEPLSALDYKMRKEMQFELKKMHEQLGITFVFVTHDQEEALALSDKVVVMAGGQIQQEGSPEAIYNEPSNIFVADFIGDCNIFDGQMSGEKRVTFAGSEFECVDDVPIGGHVSVVIRPEDVEIVPKEDGKIIGTVTSTEFQGIFYVTYVEFSDYEMEIHSLKHVSPGTEVGLTVADDMIHLIPVDVSVNVFTGTIVSVTDGITRIEFADFEYETKASLGEAGSVVTGHFEPGEVTMSDDLNAGEIVGIIDSFIYIGDRYSYTIKTESKEEYVVDDTYLWNTKDKVSISLGESLKITGGR